MKSFFVVLGILFLFIPFNSYSDNGFSAANHNYSNGQVSDHEEQAGAILREILAETARYCDKLKGLNLTFNCTAEIEETIYDPFLASLQGRIYPHTREHHQYVYGYLFEKVDDQIEEKWTLLKENGVAKNTQVPGPHLRRFYTIWPVYGPLEFLSRFWQTQYVYKLKGRKSIESLDAYMVEASPKSPAATGKDYVTIWFGIENSSLLKIAWRQPSLDNPDVQTQYVDPKIELAIEYFMGIAGIRLPTKYSINEEYQKDEMRLVKSRTTILYKNYEFAITGKVIDNVDF